MIKKIGVLTSGGDSQGMNAAVAGVIKAAFKENIQPYIVKDGYFGLVNNLIEPATYDFAESIMKWGGTVIGSARLPEFKDLEVRKKAVDNLKKHNIEALVVIGGDGSYMGALKLTEMGINCIGIPGTIDNDIASSDFTIGFDTAINIVVDSLDKIRDTIQSHNRCAVVEVMGRYCGDIAYYAGIASGADVISISENKISEADIIDKVKKLKQSNKRSVLVLVSEHLYDVDQLAKDIEKTSGYVSRASVLGHIQRGGIPTALDRFNAFMMGVEAIEQLKQGKGGLCIGIVNNKFIANDITKALDMKRPSRKKEVNKITIINDNYSK
ncbi:6-phosphofructokinase [Spiroplasma endosymbiont of Amphibalanus improvisus]|uniref:6-phosphofructokinase n=1 Tax=Spiroplasma endosymbiont of Amphibalanus improvisus TaxID=3066327 RepID=UPI00313AFC17